MNEEIEFDVVQSKPSPTNKEDKKRDQWGGQLEL